MKLPERDKASGRWLRATNNEQYRGRQYVRLKVLDVDYFKEPSGQTKRFDLCHCECGNLCKVNLCRLYASFKPTKSCGCYCREVCYNG